MRFAGHKTILKLKTAPAYMDNIDDQLEGPNRVIIFEPKINDVSNQLNSVRVQFDEGNVFISK
jgi:hypothetical protein